MRFRLTYITLTWILLIGTLSLMAQPVPSPFLPFDPDATMERLDNGLTYYIRRNTVPQNSAQLYLVLKVGSVLEDDDQLGLAHFVEHMGFNGTENFPGNTLDDYLSSIGTGFGGGLNAMTSLDRTVYILPARTDNAEQFDKAFLILSEWAARMTFDHDEIDAERGVIIEELRGRRGANDRMMRQQYQVLYAGSPYAERMPIGTQDILETFPYQRIKDFYNDWYRPDLMAVVAVGDFDVNNVRNLIKKHFDNIPLPKQTRPFPEITVPTHTDTKVSILTDSEASQTTIFITHKHPYEKPYRVGDFRNNLVYQLLMSMLNTRFTEISGQADPPFTMAYSYYGMTVNPLIEFLLIAVTDQNKIMSGYTALITELERAKQHGFHESEFQRAKNKIMVHTENAHLEKDTVQSAQIARSFTNHFVTGSYAMGTENNLILTKLFFDGITLDEINNALKNITPETNRVVALTAPETNDFHLPTERQILSLLNTIPNQKLEMYPDTAIDKPLLLKKPKRVKVSKPVHDNELDIYTWTLKNGAIVHLKSTDFKNNEILFNGSRFGGHAVANDDIFLSAAQASNIMAQSGMGNFNKSQLDNYLSGKNVNITSRLLRHFDEINGSSSVANFETLMQLIYLNFTTHRFDESAFAVWRNSNEIAIRNRANSPEAIYDEEVTKVQYNDHPRLRELTLEDITKIDHRTAYNFYKSRFDSPTGFHFTFVGNIDHEQLHKFIEEYIAPLPQNKKVNQSVVDRNIRLNREPRREEVFQGQEEKSIVTILFSSNLPEHSRKHMLTIRAANFVLNRMLSDNVREKLSGVYYIHSYPRTMIVPFSEISWVINFGCSPERVEELIQASLLQINNILENDFDEKYLSNYKETFKINSERDLRTNEFWRERIIDLKLRNTVTTNDLINQTDLVNDMTKQDVVDIMKKYINIGTMQTIVLFPDKN